MRKDIKVVELDTDKQYAIIFPEYTSVEEFKHATKAIKDIGVDKFISVHKSSDTKFVRMAEVDEE